jgi:iron complex transport system ATP-binding protein
MEGLINISNLTIGYEKCAIISNISAAAMPNEMVCIIGRNGQGKSTLIKTLCKLLPPISGSIDINQQNLLKLNDNEFSKLISVVLTSKITIYNTSVKEFVAYGRYPYTNWIGKLTDNDQEIIDNAIKLCDINHLINRDFGSLSDGEKQKVNIARAIAQQTPIIILDEPTAHLDLVNNMEIFKLLKELTQHHNKTIIFSTHHIESAIRMADQLWVVNNGTFYADAPKILIKQNIINELFNNTGVTFNNQTFVFDYNN